MVCLVWFGLIVLLCFLFVRLLCFFRIGLSTALHGQPPLLLWPRYLQKTRVTTLAQQSLEPLLVPLREQVGAPVHDEHHGGVDGVPPRQVHHRLHQALHVGDKDVEECKMYLA